jgi:hypothetical protein
MTFLWRDLGTLRLSTNHENPGRLARRPASSWAAATASKASSPCFRRPTSPSSPRIIAKPDGLFVITPKMGPAFVETLPVETIPRCRAGNKGEDEAARDQNGSTSESRRLPSFRGTSGSRGHIIAGLRAASTNGLFEPTGSENLSAKTPLPPISSHSKPRATRSSQSSRKSGAIARAQTFAGAR